MNASRTFPTQQPEPDVDAVIIGGGFGGLYATHRMRNVLGLRVQSFDAGAGPGGTWYWNRYPGARCDIESVSYSYSFDEDLQREWRWSERFAGQPEIEAYLNHVADRFDLRRSFEFGTRVTSVVWSDADRLWTVSTDTGRTVTARFVVAAPGALSLAKSDEFPGLRDFRGEVYRTSSWPAEEVDLTGKRVAVIGTGSTGIQILPELARVADQVLVFQRTPNYACPLGNRPLTDEEWNEATADYPALRRHSRSAFGGLPYPAPVAPSAFMVDDETRRQVYEKYYNGGVFRVLGSTFGDLMFNKPANDTLADFIRDKIRTRVKDPVVAELLCPDDHPYGAKRPPFESDYYECFNRDNVSLVDLRSAPIETITPDGLRTSAEDHEFDVLILATGFDALTGPLLAMNIVGRDGVPLRDAWSDGPRSHLGLAAPGFPNLFTVVGPQSPSVQYNFPLGIEDHVDYLGDIITMMRERGVVTFEATDDAARRWSELVVGLGNRTLIPLARTSWYAGTNVPGKPSGVMFFTGGVPLYRAICAEVQAAGYAGFALDGEAAPLTPLLDLDPAIALVIGGMMGGDPRPIEEFALEELRGLMGGPSAEPPAPGRSGNLITTSYASGGIELPVRVYLPDSGATDVPVVVFFHSGGWIAGSIEACEVQCRALADELGAVVIAPSYRLAPEHPFPAATDDTVAALRWVAEKAGEFGGDPRRIAVVGESAGGTLAAIAAHRLREEGGPALAAQVLVYPPIAPDADTPSRHRYRHGPILSTALLDRMWSLYLNDPAAGRSPLAAPSRAPSLAGLPPALVVTVEADPARDEAEAYAGMLAEAGVPAGVVRVPGLAHGSFGMLEFVPPAREILRATVDFLNANLVASDPSAQLESVPGQ